MTKDEFFKQWEGSFEDMSHYMRYKTITDDPELDAAWKMFVVSLQDLQDILDDWEDLEPEDDDE